MNAAAFAETSPFRRAAARPQPAIANEASAELSVADTGFVAFADGVLWQPEDQVLVVADLHLEKGSSFAARRGQMLPPYDTAATLAALSAAIFRLDPRWVIALGDSFHDNDGVERLSFYDRSALAALQRGRDWLWIAGNHDDALPAGIGGDRCMEAVIGSLVLRHEPTEGAAPGEIAGHLHPAARVGGRSGSVRRRCFISDGNRLIMPAFGAYAGGLNVLQDVFRPLFPDVFRVFVLGQDAVYPVASSRLRFG